MCVLIVAAGPDGLAHGVALCWAGWEVRPPERFADARIGSTGPNAAPCAPTVMGRAR